MNSTDLLKKRLTITKKNGSTFSEVHRFVTDTEKIRQFSDF